MTPILGTYVEIDLKNIADVNHFVRECFLITCFKLIVYEVV